MDKGLKFAIREGGRTVGAGVVMKLLNSFRDQYLIELTKNRR